MLASTPEIGYLIPVSQQAFQVATTFGGMFLLAILVWALDMLLLAVQRRVVRWHRDLQEQRMSSRGWFQPVDATAESTNWLKASAGVLQPSVRLVRPFN